MSDENEGPPPLSPQLHEFFEEHAKTGEPTQAELGRALLRLHGATRPTMFSMAGRRLLPPEVLAVAAVLVLSVGGAFIGWRVRTANAQTEALTQAKAAWVRGDLDAASAAFEACSTAECARLAAAVKRAKVQSENLEGLDEAEEGSLLALDRELSEGERSVLAERLDKKPAPIETEQVFATKQFAVLERAGFPTHVVSKAVSDFLRASMATSPDEARLLLAGVVKLVPDTELGRAAQKKLSGLEAAERGADSLRVAPQSSSAAFARLKFAELVSTGSQPNVPSPTPSTEAASLCERGFALEDSAPDEARALFEAAIASAPTSLEASKAIIRVKFLDDRKEAGRKRAPDVYLRGFMLRDTSPSEARRLFSEVIELAPESIEADKARKRLEELDAAPSDEITQEEDERETTLALAINERKTMVIKGLTRVALGDSETADIRTLGNDRLEVRGLRPGKTTLLIWTGDGKRVAYVVSVIRGANGARVQLKFNSNPSGATVFLDGKSTGRRTPVLPVAPLVVPMGRHTIQFDLNGKRSAPQEVDVVEGANPVISGEIPQ